MPLPTNLCQQEAMTHLNPKSCLLSAQHTMDHTWQDIGHQPHWPLPKSQPGPKHGAAEVSPCWSSVTLMPATARSTEASQKQQQWQVGSGH